MFARWFVYLLLLATLPLWLPIVVNNRWTAWQVEERRKAFPSGHGRIYHPEDFSWL
jgi:membrane-associated phospholipid phosphatase